MVFVAVGEGHADTGGGGGCGGDTGDDADVDVGCGEGEGFFVAAGEQEGVAAFQTCDSFMGAGVRYHVLIDGLLRHRGGIEVAFTGADNLRFWRYQL